jgi:hypothetical protein
MERFLQLGLQAEAGLRVMIAIASLMVERDDPRAVEALNRTVQIALKHDSSNWHTHLISLRNTANDVGDTILITTIDKAIAQTEAMELEQLRNRLIEQGALLEEVISSEPVSTGRNLRFDHGLFLDMMRFSAPINIIVAARLSDRTYSEITDGSDFEKIARCLCDLVEARNTCNLPSNPTLLYEALKAANEMEQFESTGRPTFRHQTVLRIINLMKQEQHPNLSAAYTLYGQVLEELKGAVLDGIKNKQAGQLEYHLDDKVQYCKMAIDGLLDLLKEEGTTTELYSTQVDELIALLYLEYGNGVVGMTVVAKDLQKYAPERLDEHMPKLAQALKEAGNDQLVKVLAWSDSILDVMLEQDDVNLIIEIVPSLSKLVGLSGVTGQRIASVPGIIWRREKRKQAVWAYQQLYVYNTLTGFAYISAFEKGLWFFQRVWQQSVARKTTTGRTRAQLNLILNIVLLPLTLLFAIFFLIVLPSISAMNKRRKRSVSQSQSKKDQSKQRNERSFQIGMGKMLALHGIERRRAAKRIAGRMVHELRHMATQGNITVKEKWLKEFAEVLDSVGFHEEKQSLQQAFPAIGATAPQTDTVKVKALTKWDLVKPVISGRKKRYLSQYTEWLERTTQQIKAFDELPDELPIWIIAESLRVLAPVRKEYQELFDIITKPSLDKD